MFLDDRSFRASRTLPCAADRVYQAFENPSLLAAWWGPEGFVNVFQRFEFWVGGHWDLVMHGPDGRQYPNHNRFEALEPGRLVVVRHDCAPWFTLTISLTPADGGTGVDWLQVFDDVQTARAVRAVVEPANAQNLERLARVLAG